MQRALEAMQERLYAAIDGARFERRSDLIVLVWPGLPIPQCNGAWVVEDSRTAVEALAEAIGEVEATGISAWVQTRSGHDRIRRQALDLGLTQSVRVPGMVVESAELVEPVVEIEIGLVGDEDVDGTNQSLATSFEAPKELFDEFCGPVRQMDEASWYVGRAGGAIVSTAVGVTLDSATECSTWPRCRSTEVAATEPRSPPERCATVSKQAPRSPFSSRARWDTASTAGSAFATSRSTSC